MAGSAKSGFEDEDGGTITDINIVPLVDVTLVLLIVFMITVPAIVASAPIKVDVPKTNSAAITADRLPINLSLRREEKGEVGIYVNGTRTDEAGLKQLVRDLAVPGGGEQETFLAADRTIAYGEVVKVMDLLSSMGLHKISLDTKHVPGP